MRNIVTEWCALNPLRVFEDSDQGFLVVEIFDVEDMSNFAKTMSNFGKSVSKLLARAVPAPCFRSVFLTTAAYRASCLR
jgi:hypothetical protein